MHWKKELDPRLILLFESPHTTKKEVKNSNSKRLSWRISEITSTKEGLSSKQQRKPMIDTQHARSVRFHSALLAINCNLLTPKHLRLLRKIIRFTLVFSQALLWRLHMESSALISHTYQYHDVLLDWLSWWNGTHAQYFNGKCNTIDKLFIIRWLSN